MRINLRSKTLILLAAVSLIPLALMVVTGIYFINITQRYAIYQLENQLLRQKEKEIEKFFADVLVIFHPQITYPVAALSAVPSDQREFLLKEISKTNKYISEVGFMEYDFSYPDKPEVGMELNKLVKGEAATDLISQRNSAEFQKAVAGGDYIGPVHRTGENYFVTIAAPVKNNDGVVIGVIAGEISLDPVARIINDGALGNSGYVFLSDDKGEIWAKPPHLEYKNFGSNVYVLSVLGGYNNFSPEVQDEYRSSFGGDVIAGGRKIKDLNWALAAEWPKADAYSTVYLVEKQAAIFLFIILGVVAAAAYFFGQRIVKPIIILERGAKIIGGGDLSHRIEINTKDELEELAAYFNEMTQSLKGVQELRESKARMEGLAKSLEKEKELSEIKDNFISTASHQLRTPISVIRWSSEILRDAGSGASAEEMQSQLDSIYKNAEALALITGDILTVAELGIGYQPKEKTEFSLKKAIESVLDSYQKDIKMKSIAVTFNTPGGECQVKASGVNIKRVLENLVDNAATYTKEGGAILIELGVKDDKISFSIKDNGIGIPAEDQKFIFGEFFRARNAIEMKNVGTGLGLFIVKTIVEGHKGEIGFKSSPAGSKFWFSLPAQS